MRILWLHDEKLLEHPVASLAIKSLREQHIEVVLATGDSSTKHCSSRYFQDEPIAVSRFHARIAGMYKPIRHKHLRFASIINGVKNLDKRLSRWRGRIQASRFAAAIQLAQEDSNVVIVSRGRLLICVLPWVAIRRIQRRSTKLVYPPFELFGQQGFREPRWETALERAVIKRIVCSVITQNSARREYYLRINKNIPVTVVQNFGPADLYPTEMTSSESDTQKVKVIYAGLLTKKRDIKTLVDAFLELEPKFELTLLGPQQPDFLPQTKSSVRELVASGRLQILEAIPRVQLGHIFGRHQIGVLSYDDSCLNNRLCAPTKFTDYLHCGLSVIAPNVVTLRDFSTDFPWIHHFNQGSATSIAEAIQDAAEYRSLNFGPHFVTRSRVLNWESECTKLIDELRRVVSSIQSCCVIDSEVSQEKNVEIKKRGQLVIDKSDQPQAGADFSGADLQGVRWPNADLWGANLKGANLKGANLREANLVGANLKGANLKGANLKGANLMNANLKNANCKGANFSGANLERTERSGANFEGADLTDAQLY